MPVRLVITIGLLFAAGCGESDSANVDSADVDSRTPTGEQPATADSKPPADSTADSPEVSLDILNETETNELIASHQGRIVVVDLWALW